MTLEEWALAHGRYIYPVDNARSSQFILLQPGDDLSEIDSFTDYTVANNSAKKPAQVRLNNGDITAQVTFGKAQQIGANAKSVP